MIVNPYLFGVPVPVNTAIPTFSGTMWAGFTLTGTTGTWTNAPTSYAYQWYSNGVAIGGATASTFVLTAAQDGTDITLGVTASNAGGPGLQALSAATAMHEYINALRQAVAGATGDSTALGSNFGGGPGPDATGKGYYYDLATDTINMITTTDIPGTNTGSMYPALCIAHYDRTGIALIIADCGIGGTKFYGDAGGGWGEVVSVEYSAAVTKINAAKNKAGVDKVFLNISSLGVNDQKSGDPLPNVQAAVFNYADKLIADFPYSRILHWVSGFEGTNNARGGKVKGYQRECAISKARFELVGQNLAFNLWGLYSADQIHLSQPGQNLQGQMVDRYLTLSTTTFSDKRARTMINSFYTFPNAARQAALQTLYSNLGTVMDDVISMFLFVNTTNNDLIDMGMIIALSNDGYVFNANANITTNTNQSARMAISSVNCDYRYTYTDIGFVTRTIDRKGAFGGTTKYLFGQLSGTSVFGVAETAAGVIQFFAWDNNTAFTGSGGIADNTRYGVERQAGDKRAIVNGAVAGTTTVAAGVEATSGNEIGARYNAGAQLFLNTELAYSALYKASTFNRALFDSEMETFLTTWIANP